MRAHQVCMALTVALSLDSGAAFSGPTGVPDPRADRIVGMAMTQGGAQAFLQRLTDSIGARVTGSPESRATADLLLRTLREAGFEDAHFEEYALASRWQRERAVGHVVSPVMRPLAVGSYGWVPGTKGEVTASLVDLGAPPKGDRGVSADRVRGAAVIVEPYAVKEAPSQVMRAALARELARAGATAMLIPSDKPNRMLYTSAFGFYPGAPLPVLSVAREDVLFLRRLIASGPVRLTLDVANTIDPSPSQERNVVADIRGTTPGEVVLVGAHFDSWDFAQGAQDDGVGVAAVVDAARILKSLGIQPRRTIRFVLFSGEEQALLGSRAYVETHRKELDGLKAVMIMDWGAETPRGFKVHGRSDVEAAARTVLAPLSSLGASGVSLEASFDMDHGPFLAEGIPVFTLWVDEGEYDTHHHAASDTLDKVDPQKLALDTAVMAVTAYRLATAPEAPGRRLSATEVTQLLEKLGLESLRRAVSGSPGAAAPATPAPEPVPAHETFTIDSRVLSETRVINLYTPPGYEKAGVRYPVLYMPDGGVEEDFPHVTNDIDSAIRAGEMQPVIVVGVENTERRRDMTGPTTVEADRKIASRVGGSAAFRAFIRDELMPEIGRRVRGNGRNAIVGESLAGLFVVETFFQEPQLFETSIALSPSLWWNDQALVRGAAARWKAQPQPVRTLYLASAGDDDRGDAVKNLAEVLRTAAPKGLTWYYEPRPDQKHSTIYRGVSPEVFRKLFPPAVKTAP